MTYAAIIIDDEAMGAETIRLLLEKESPEIHPVFVCTSALKGIEAIKQERPSLVFIDIEMPVMNGFDVLNALPERNFECIFITSYSHYALEAFKHNAIDYILKPVSQLELRLAVEKAKKRLNAGDAKMMLAIQDMLQSMKSQNEKNKFAIQAGGEVIFADLNEILYFEADVNYTNIVIDKRRKIVSSKNLKKIEEGITSSDFMRIHNSYIINLNNVIQFHKGISKKVIMKDGRELEVSRTKTNELVQRLEKIFPNLF